MAAYEYSVVAPHGNIHPMDKRARYAYDYTFFDQIDTETKAYFLGLITADGYVVEGPTRYAVNLGSTDKDLPHKLRAAIQGTMPVYEILPDRKKRWQTEWRLSICSKYMVSTLVALGVRQRKSLSETFCANVPTSLYRHYIRGIFDGDGSLGIYGKAQKPQARIGLVGSKSLLTSIRDIFSCTLGVPPSIVALKLNNLYRLQYNGNILARHIIAWLYEDIMVAMQRKSDIAQNILAQPEARAWTRAHFGTAPPKLTVFCFQCGKALMRHQQDILAHVFCTHKCQGAYLKQEIREGQLNLFPGQLGAMPVGHAGRPPHG